MLPGQNRENSQIQSSLSKIGLAPKCLVVPRYILSTITYKYIVIFASLFACAQLQINLENYEEKFAPGLNKIPTTKCIQEIWGQSRTVSIIIIKIKHRKFEVVCIFYISSNWVTIFFERVYISVFWWSHKVTNIIASWHYTLQKNKIQIWSNGQWAWSMANKSLKITERASSSHILSS